MMRSALCVAMMSCTAVAQQAEPSVAKDSLSIHKIERGTMPLREMAAGSIASVDPAVATITTDRPIPPAALKSGQPFNVQLAVRPPQMLGGIIGKVIRHSDSTTTAEVALTRPLPSGVVAGMNVGALVNVGEAKDVVFFERPFDAKPDTEATIFLLDSSSAYAKRVPVKYGRLSGSLLEIVSGLSPGDRVIVTDMSAYAQFDRVRLN
jgi:HlyD family secretion protein